MCKFIRRIICLIIIVSVALAVVIILKGGDPFRWLGEKSEEAGRLIHERSSEFADDADKLKETGEEVKEKVEDAGQRTKELIKK